jgi:hypothetical protein
MITQSLIYRLEINVKHSLSFVKLFSLNMKSFIIFLSLIAISTANPFINSRDNILVRYRNGVRECRLACGGRFDTCPQVPCDQPPLDRQCLPPNCSSGRSRQFLFPNSDPRKYYQCAPNILNGNYIFEVVVRDCGCLTYFDYAQQACVFPADWNPQCISTPIPPPQPTECPRECPTC